MTSSPPIQVEVLDWEFPNEFGGPKRCGILVRSDHATTAPLPVLIALHGLGETTSPAIGANGWPRVYGLERSYRRLLDAPLLTEDFEGLITSERLSDINDSLRQRPFGGLIVACPYLPRDIGWSVPFAAYGRWLTERLLPRLRSELRADIRTATTGIDGVSLGGWAALKLALAQPETFGVVGTLQAAISDFVSIEYASGLIARDLRGRPFRIVTSSSDVYRSQLQTLDRRLTERGVPHEFLMTVGPHDYPWNRGPGGIEMLLWHDRMLRMPPHLAAAR